MNQKEQTTSFLKECLADALLTLMEKEDYSQITVAQIAAEANVGRATYYRHFKSKDDLIIFKFYQVIDEWSKNNPHLGSLPPDEIVAEFIGFFYLNRKLVSLIYHAGMKNLLLSFLLKFFLSPSDNTFEDYRQTGITYYFYGIIDKWISGNFKESPQELAKIMLTILREYHLN